MPTAAATRSRPLRVGRRACRCVGAQRAGAGEDADERAVGVDDRRQAVPAAAWSRSNACRGVDAVGQREQVAGHDVVELGEAVDARRSRPR